jgi:hypothetical protein
MTMMAGLQIWQKFGLNIEQQTRSANDISVFRSVSAADSGQYLSF